MRRKDREITDRSAMEAILLEAPVCRLALADGEEPYVVPLCFGYADNTVWVHSAREGKKIDMLIRNPRCCVEVDICGAPIKNEKPCSWEFRYRSVICHGRAEIVEDPEEKRTGLACILRHYGAGDYSFTEKDLDRVCVVKIAIDAMTGKKYGIE
jgi:nitroimidazol reductase NimA-like FMN-containing flavoprotein (pyridoxamine 5'-phosphate oxidase superfamily)